MREGSGSSRASSLLQWQSARGQPHFGQTLPTPVE